MSRPVAILTLLLLAVRTATGQSAGALGEALRGPEDIGDLKVLAERGEAAAQVKLAGAYLANGRPVDARRWFTTAAEQNSAEGQFQLGNLLLSGHAATQPEQRVAPDPVVALPWIYRAATNGHKSAWRTLARCLQAGDNCATNLPEAYAWLNLLADSGDVAGRNEMNRLALELSLPDIQAGKTICAGMKTGHWPAPPVAENPLLRQGLRVRGIAISSRGKLAIIGNRNLAEGEQTVLNLGGRQVRLTCLSIESNSVQVQIEGEARPRTLTTSLETSPVGSRK